MIICTENSYMCSNWNASQMTLHYFHQKVPFHWNFRWAFLCPSLKFRHEMLRNTVPDFLTTKSYGFIDDTEATLHLHLNQTMCTKYWKYVSLKTYSKSSFTTSQQAVWWPWLQECRHICSMYENCYSINHFVTNVTP